MADPIQFVDVLTALDVPTQSQIATLTDAAAAAQATADAAVTPDELAVGLAGKLDATSAAITAVGGALIADTLKTISGTTYTVLAGDAGYMLRFTSGSAVTVTLPSSLGAGFNALWRQVGAGQITFTPASGTLRNVYGNTKSYGQYAEGVVSVDTSGDWYLSGDTA